MRIVVILLSCLLLTGCQFLPSIPKIDWKNPFGGKKEEKSNTSEAATKAAAEIAAAKAAEDAAKKASEADKKVEEARKKMETEYAVFRAQLQKAYDDKDKKDLENFQKIGELNYGIYHVTQANKKTDINTTIAHLRSKEIMVRTDLLNETQKETIKKEVEEERKKTIDELYIKYKASIDLAANQKAALDAAEALIAQKEKEKQALREANKLTLDRLEREKQAELEKIKHDTETKVKAAKEAAAEAQRLETVAYMVKGLIGIGFLFFILGALLKSFTMIGSAIGAFALAYTASTVATIPVWIILSAIGVILLLVVWCGFYSSVKERMKKPILNPKDTAGG